MPPNNHTLLTFSLKQKMKAMRELYGMGPLPPLQQVVKDRYYYRGECSRIRCSRCDGLLNESERHNLYGMCDACESKTFKSAPLCEDATLHNHRMLSGMVLAGSCDYERWS